MTLKFEGDVTGISEVQMNFIASILKERGFSNGKATVSSVGKADDNFGSTMKRLSIEKDGKFFGMVAKVAPPTGIMRTKMNIGRMFLVEQVMYTGVFPKFTELEKAVDIDESERFRYAECYGALVEEPNEIILLEDLQLSGFALLDRHKYYIDDTVKLVLKNYAKLHSLSYVLKNREPETYEDFKRKLGFNWGIVTENDGFKKIYHNIEDRLLPLLDNVKHRDAVTGVAKRCPEYIAENHELDRDSIYSVIQQGDCWNNNMMFVKSDDTVVKCCLIDYQAASNNNPAADLHYMIFACTDYETRSKHYHEWIDYYHAQVDASLGNFGLKASSVYPRDQLNADLKRLAKVGFGITLMLANMVLVDTQKGAEMKETLKDDSKDLDAVFNFSGEHDDSPSATNFKVRVIGLVKSFVELGYL